MINKDIIKLASNTINVGLKNKFTHKSTLKNNICGDKITLELITNKNKINSMKYELEACIYCEASASLLSRNIKNLDIDVLKKEFLILKKNMKNKKILYPKHFVEFKKIINSDNFIRHKCVFLPFDAVLKALK